MIHASLPKFCMEVIYLLSVVAQWLNFMMDMDLLIYWRMVRAHIKEANIKIIFWNLCIVIFKY
jgi:hypothetical protein